jgi:hypothetical protein
MIILFGLLWLLNQIATDLIRNIPIVDYYRGWAKIGVTLIHFSTLYLIINNNKKRLIVFILGLCVGDLLGFIFNPNIYALDYPWKFGVGGPLTIIIVVIAGLIYKRSIFLCNTLLGFASAINLYMDFRSLSGICFLTIIYLSIQYQLMVKNKQNANLSLRQIILLISVLTLASFTFLKGYEQLAKHGFLGDIAQKKYIWQSSGDLGIIVGGRSEILVASRAILSSPIIGYGSWAKDYYFSDLLNNIMRSMGYSQRASNELELIPAHSHFFGAWVESGIFGAMFWGFILALIARALVMNHKEEKLYIPLLIFISFHLLWDVLFSPFGADQRFTTPFNIIFLMAFLPDKKENIFKQSI